MSCTYVRIYMMFAHMSSRRVVPCTLRLLSLIRRKQRAGHKTHFMTANYLLVSVLIRHQTLQNQVLLSSNFSP